MRRAPSDLLEEVGRLLSERNSALVLERVARGAGSTRWWSCASTDDFLGIYAQLRPGSDVVVYAGEEVHVDDLDQHIEARIWEAAAAQGEVLFGAQRPGTTEFEAFFLDPNELEAALSRVSRGDRVLWGLQPATETGPDALAFTPPDDDGVVRPQPV